MTSSAFPDSPKLVDLAHKADRWTQDYQDGLTAFKRRDYADSELHLLAAISEASRLTKINQQLISSRLALADTYIAQERFLEALKLLNAVAPYLERVFGEESLPYVRYLRNSALIKDLMGNFSQACNLGRRAEKIAGKVDKDGYEHGQSLYILATILGRQGWFDEAEPLYWQAVRILQQDPNSESNELADTLRSMALFYQAQGKVDQADELFKHSLRLKETLVIFNRPERIAGAVTVHWDRGARYAKVVQEGRFPVKYLTINGVRVAVTLADLGKRLGLLISLRNNTSYRMELDLGQVAIDVVKPRPTRILPVNIDSNLRILEERSFVAETEDQPFLHNLETTRKTAGYIYNGLPDIAHNLGANVFSNRYGEWDMQNRSERSTHGYGAESSPDFTRSPMMAGLIPISLAAGESMTGLEFFDDPHMETAVVRIVIGNTTLKFPFVGPPKVPSEL